MSDRQELRYLTDPTVGEPSHRYDYSTLRVTDKGLLLEVTLHDAGRAAALERAFRDCKEHLQRVEAERLDRQAARLMTRPDGPTMQLLPAPKRVVPIRACLCTRVFTCPEHRGGAA